MREEEKILSGILFAPGTPELVAIKLRSHKLSREYSLLLEDQAAEQIRIAREMLGAYGEGSFMQGPVFFHYGVHTRIGKRCFFNANLTVQDDAPVTIGDDCNFGPNVTIVTPVHPMLPDERKWLRAADGSLKHMCYARPVKIGHDCWIGANAVICPGVTIGDNCVIGAGSVVTRDVPANSFAAGNPCRVIREITEADSMKHKPEILADNSVIEKE